MKEIHNLVKFLRSNFRQSLVWFHTGLLLGLIFSNSSIVGDYLLEVYGPKFVLISMLVSLLVGVGLGFALTFAGYLDSLSTVYEKLRDWIFSNKYAAVLCFIGFVLGKLVGLVLWPSWIEG